MTIDHTKTSYGRKSLRTAIFLDGRIARRFPAKCDGAKCLEVTEEIQVLSRVRRCGCGRYDMWGRGSFWSRRGPRCRV